MLYYTGYYLLYCLLSGYGLTETSPGAIAGSTDERGPGSSGLVLPSTEVKVV